MRRLPQNVHLEMISIFMLLAFSSRLGYEEHIPGQTRDWNEELQTTRELARKHLPERLIRERTIFKVHSDFVVAATRGAMAVIDGNIMAINPGEDTKLVKQFALPCLGVFEVGC
jgi:Clustered mitochondria